MTTGMDDVLECFDYSLISRIIECPLPVMETLFDSTWTPPKGVVIDGGKGKVAYGVTGESRQTIPQTVSGKLTLLWSRCSPSVSPPSLLLLLPFIIFIISYNDDADYF